MNARLVEETAQPAAMVAAIAPPAPAAATES